jgi:biopolymer transport protein TolR
MRKYKKDHKRNSIAEINVVPYIDVMLVLLIIFMVTAPLLSQGVDVALPQAAAKVIQPPPVPPIVLSVNNNGNYYLNISKSPGTPISVPAIKDLVQDSLAQAKQKGEKQDIYVKGDKTASYGEVVKAFVLLQQAGAADVGLITDGNNKG